MMKVSDKQLKANRVNAQKGGVKTGEGKAVVRFNACKHGILGNLISEYENGFYGQILDQLIDEFKPKTTVETILVERIAVYYFRLQRLAKAENEFIKTCVTRPEHYDPYFTHTATPKEVYSSAIKSNDIFKLYKLYGRYETAIENRLYRALQELKRL